MYFMATTAGSKMYQLVQLNSYSIRKQKQNKLQSIPKTNTITDIQSSSQISTII